MTPAVAGADQDDDRHRQREDAAAEAEPRVHGLESRFGALPTPEDATPSGPPALPVTGRPPTAHRPR